ncbi:unnamed protein product [Soboliphyme baturini]|uniref:Pex2_Pex12 domain-containing protein n=1 Tax=Soboliphyme baturini TaxID=241478 RepID=A0A183J760_9BILA|nr:unnamed protein product [Soboliphyme baturini]
MDQIESKGCGHSKSELCIKCLLADAFNLKDDDLAPTVARTNDRCLLPSQQDKNFVTAMATCELISDEHQTASNRSHPVCQQREDDGQHQQGFCSSSGNVQSNPATIDPEDMSDGPAYRRQSLLLRLFESKLFTITIAVQYLFNSKEPGVLTYLGNRLFSFAEEEFDFYLPQIVTLYINVREVAEVLHPYVVYRYAAVFSCVFAGFVRCHLVTQP